MSEKPKRRAFWSARTLRVELWDEEGFLTDTTDILGVDRDRCVFAYDNYGPLIERLLNEHFEKERANAD